MQPLIEIARGILEFTALFGQWGQAYIILVILTYIVYMMNEMVPTAAWVHNALRGDDKLTFPPFLRNFMPAKRVEWVTAGEFVPPTVFIRPMIFCWFICILLANTFVGVFAALFWVITVPLALYPIFAEFVARVRPTKKTKK